MRDPSALCAMIVNDDGITAPGLAVLEDVARNFFSEVYVVAPAGNCSGAGHSFTLNKPLRVNQQGPDRYAVEGTPTDCVMLGLQSILVDKTVDVVLSGVNNGANMGDDVTYSGTIGAAMEARLLGVPAMAFSQASTDHENTKWECARKHLPDILGRLLTLELPDHHIMNVNFPNCGADQVQGFRFAPQGHHKKGDEIVSKTDPRGRPYHWLGAMRQREDFAPDSDVATVKAKMIAATPLSANLTSHSVLEHLQSLTS